MGYIAHHALIVVISGYAMDVGRHAEFRTPDITAYRETLPEEFRRLLIGPVTTAINGDCVVSFLPDGSKEGWGTSDQADAIRAELASMFSFQYDDGSSPFDVIEVRFGGDDPELAHCRDPRPPLSHAHAEHELQYYTEER